MRSRRMRSSARYQSAKGARSRKAELVLTKT